MTPTKHPGQVLALATAQGNLEIGCDTIIRVEALSSYSKVFFVDEKGRTQKLVVSKVLRWFEENLPSNFIRIHRTHLLNRNYIHQYAREKNIRIELRNGEWFDVAKRKRTGFLQDFAGAA